VFDLSWPPLLLGAIVAELTQCSRYPLLEVLPANFQEQVQHFRLAQPGMRRDPAERWMHLEMT